MDNYVSDSCHHVPWQATLEGILSNLQDEFRVASVTKELRYKPVSKKFTTEALFMIYVILIFIILNFIGSFMGGVELFCKKFGTEISSKLINGKVKSINSAVRSKNKKKYFESSFCTDVWKNCKKYLECFSIQNNGRKLLSTVSGEEQFNSLHGIKTISLIWVLVSHVCMFHATILKTVSDDFQYILEFPVTQIILNGIFTNDVFFVLSGFMTAYTFFDYYTKRKGKIPWVLFYISRFLRFTPLYLLTLGFYATLFPYIDSGPLWPTYNTNPICRENWIWNVLYLNNFLTHKKQCMLTTWYIACDLQLYIISPLFLLLLMRRPKIGLALIFTCVFGSCLTSFILTNHYELIDGISKLALHSQNMAPFYSRFWVYFDIVYVKPYTRIGSYLIGVTLGYFVFQRKLSECKRNSLMSLSIGWFVSIIFLLIAFFAIYNRDESAWERGLYNGLKHPLCACSISWIIFVCVTGQGGFINKLLSLKLFIPFSRLSYCFYFIHIIAIEKYFLSINELTDFTLVSAVFLHLRLLLWTLAASFAVSLIFERPLLNLLGLLLKKDKPENKVQ